MTRDELISFRTMELGKLAAEKINPYYVSRSDRDISNLFHILNEIAKRVIYSNYRGIETHLLDDTVAQASEDVLGTIYLTKHIPYIWCTGQLKQCILQNVAFASSST